MPDQEQQGGNNANSKLDGLKIVLSTYDGSSDPKPWLRQLEKVQRAKKWTDEQLIAQAPLLLTGRADDFWETIETVVKDWKTFKEKFTHEFGERKTVGEHLTDLTTITRHTDEPLDVLMGRIKKKYQKAFPTADLDAGEHKVQITEHFVRALTSGSNSIDASLGQHLQLHKLDITDPKMILKAACDLQPRITKTERGKSKSVCTVTSDDVMRTRDLEEMEERIVDRVVAALHQVPQIYDAPAQSTQASHHSGYPTVHPTTNYSWNRNPSTGGATPRTETKSCFICGSTQHLAKACQYKKACRRCWQDGHPTRSCPAPMPVQCPLNWGGLRGKRQ